VNTSFSLFSNMVQCGARARASGAFAAATRFIQADSIRHEPQIRISKHENRNKLQSRNPKPHRLVLVIGIWSFEFVWDFVLGISNFNSSQNTCP
jgi:hypothetical protein